MCLLMFKVSLEGSSEHYCEGLGWLCEVCFVKHGIFDVRVVVLRGEDSDDCGLCCVLKEVDNWCVFINV